MPLLTIPGALLASAVIGGGAAIMSGNKAASTAQSAAAQATGVQQNMYDRTRADLSPFTTAGAGSTNALLTALGLDGNGNPSAPAGPDYASYVKKYPDLVADEAKDAANRGVSADDPSELTDYGSRHWSAYGQADGRTLPTAPNPITGGANLLTGYSGQAPTYTPYSDSPGGQSAPVYQTFNPSLSDLENTPGYKFALDQGLKATQSGYAARGLGASGAAMKGAADYAEGLAGTTLKQNFDIANQNYGNKVLGYSTGLGGYTQDFNNLLSQFNTGFGAFNTGQTNDYNRLFGLSGLGEGAAAQTGGFGVQTATGIGNNITGAGNATASAQIAAGNNIANIASSIPNAFLSNKFLSMYGPGAAGLTK